MGLLTRYAETIGISVAEDGPARTVLLLPFSDALLGRPGFIHGGAIAGLLEAAIFARLRHELGDTVTVKPVTVTVDYLRGRRERPTHAAATVTRAGNRIANIEAVAWQDDAAKPIGTARMNALLDRE